MNERLRQGTSQQAPQMLEAVLTEEINRKTRRSIRNLEVCVGKERVIIRGHTCRYHYQQLALSAVMEKLGRSSPIQIVMNFHINGSAPQPSEGVDGADL